MQGRPNIIEGEEILKFKRFVAPREKKNEEKAKSVPSKGIQKNGGATEDRENVEN